MWLRAQQVGLSLLAAAGLLVLALQLYALLDLRSFEYQPLLGLLGWSGLGFILFVNAGILLGVYLSLRHVLLGRESHKRGSLLAKWFLVAWAAGTAWLLEWTFMEEPLTVALANQSISVPDRQRVTRELQDAARRDGSVDALSREGSVVDEARLSVMLGRIAVNRPTVFADASIGVTIEKYARRYDVSPVLLLHWAYIDSFYGEAPSGPMPFFREVTGEMFRDLVQAHLPSWFVESRLRVALIEGPWLDYLVGREASVKLRYALQKATYDIAIAPYMNSVYSDLFLLLEQYPEEFGELFATSGAPDPLGRAFLALKGHTLLEPYHDPYKHAARDGSYYSQYRDDLTAFGRAAVYRLSSDFDFATKTQALVARYYSEQYASRIGPDRWAQLSERQKTALLAILRDVYTPNIGRVSHNLYMVPEFNCTPIDFVAAEVAREFEAVTREDGTWLPEDRARLWGATGLMLRVLAEVWEVVSGEGLPGVRAASTVEDAVKVIARHR